MAVLDTAPGRPSVSLLEGPPRWLQTVAFVAAAAVFAFGSVGLLLALTRTYTPGLTFAIGAILFGGLIVLLRPVWRGPRTTTRRGHATAMAGLAAIVAIMAWNGANVSQHVLVNRDGGSYANSGRWIARDGSLEVRPRVGPFRTEHSSLVFASAAVGQTKNGGLQFQFAHLLPALLAEAFAIGGDRGLFLLPALLGGVALLEFFVLAWRVLRRSELAVVATLALGLTIPQVAFSRDTYSEIPSQVLLFAALGLLIDDRVLPDWRPALAAGLFLGAIQATRADAMFLFIGIPVLIAVAWLRTDPGPDRLAVRAASAALVLGVIPAFLLGLFDLTRHSAYYWATLWNEERTLIAAIAISGIVSLLGVVLWPRLAPRVRALPWNGIAWTAAGVVLVVGFGAWFVRPQVQKIHQPALIAVQRHGHLVLKYIHMEYETSMSWMSWYLGPCTVAAAILGAAVIVRCILRGQMLRWLPALVLFIPGSLLYLWNARAFTDHVWVTRRFLVTAIPMLILLALGFAAYLIGARRWRRSARVAAVVVAVLAVAFPLYTVAPVRSMSEQSGYLDVIKDACHTIGPRAAVVVLESPTLVSKDVLEDWTPQAFRGWCGADVAIDVLSIPTGGTLRRLADGWRRRGRRFFVIATGSAPILRVAPAAKLVRTRTATDRRLLSQTLTHRPHSYQTESFSLVIATLPPS